MDEIQQDLESIGQLEWKTATLEGSGARESLVEYLYVDPAEVVVFTQRNSKIMHIDYPAAL
jgi:hypothetical protein